MMIAAQNKSCPFMYKKTEIEEKSWWGETDDWNATQLRTRKNFFTRIVLFTRKTSKCIYS
jgi:hypothetical protein